MTKAEAKRQAHVIVARLIDSYFGVGQPTEECVKAGGREGHRRAGPDDQDCKDCERLTAALTEIMHYHEDREERRPRS